MTAAACADTSEAAVSAIRSSVSSSASPCATAVLTAMIASSCRAANRPSAPPDVARPLTGLRSDGDPSRDRRELADHLVDGHHPAEAPGDVLERGLVEVLTVHAVDAVADHDRRVVPLHRLEGSALL